MALSIFFPLVTLFALVSLSGEASTVESQAEISPTSLFSLGDPYDSLTITSAQKEAVYKLISTLGNRGAMSLMFQRSNLEKTGNEIQDVHALRFFGTVFSNPTLKECMRKIKKSSLKWNSFLEGYGKKLDSAANRNDLIKYVPGFSKQVQADPQAVTNYLEKRDWEGFLIYLMQ